MNFLFSLDVKKALQGGGGGGRYFLKGQKKKF